MAWIRLVADDEAPDVCRLALLADALAPAYAAVLPLAVSIPTLDLSVRVSDGLADHRSPCVRPVASTRRAAGNGLIDEQIDMWGIDGRHLGGAQQDRLVRT